MPDVAIRHKNSKIGPGVLSFPYGTSDEEIKAAVAEHGDGNWSIDKKTDPAVVLTAADIPATPTTIKEK